VEPEKKHVLSHIRNFKTESTHRVLIYRDALWGTAATRNRDLEVESCIGRGVNADHFD